MGNCRQTNIMRTKDNHLIFIADDDPFCLRAYKKHLQNIGILSVESFTSGTQLIDQLSKNPGLIFLDYNMEDYNGKDLIKKIKAINPTTYVVIISSQQEMEVAIEVLTEGAFDYIIKDGNEFERISKLITKWRSATAYHASLQNLGNNMHVKNEFVKTLIEAEEKVRNEISGELHDNINQLLGATKMYIETACKDEKNRLPLIMESKGIIETAITEIRKLSHGLSSVNTGVYYLEERILKIIADLKNQQQFSITSEIELEKVNELFVPSIQQNIVRIAQELINNAVKYSGAGKIHIALKLQGNKLLLKICDDGIGFNKATVKKGLGLQNIKERLSNIQGEYSLSAAPGQGCEWEIQVPAIMN